MSYQRPSSPCAGDGLSEKEEREKTKRREEKGKRVQLPFSGLSFDPLACPTSAHCGEKEKVKGRRD